MEEAMWIFVVNRSNGCRADRSSWQRKRWRIMAAGWKSNSKTFANTVAGLSTLFIATGNRGQRRFPQLFPRAFPLHPSWSLTRPWPRGHVFSRHGLKIVTRRFSTSIDMEKRVLDTLTHPTRSADRSTSMV